MYVKINSLIELRFILGKVCVLCEIVIVFVWFYLLYVYGVV